MMSSKSCMNLIKTEKIGDELSNFLVENEINGPVIKSEGFLKDDFNEYSLPQRPMTHKWKSEELKEEFISNLIAVEIHMISKMETNPEYKVIKSRFQCVFNKEHKCARYVFVYQSHSATLIWKNVVHYVLDHDAIPSQEFETFIYQMKQSCMKRSTALSISEGSNTIYYEFKVKGKDLVEQRVNQKDLYEWIRNEDSMLKTLREKYSKHVIIKRDPDNNPVDIYDGIDHLLKKIDDEKPKKNAKATRQRIMRYYSENFMQK